MAPSRIKAYRRTGGHSWRRHVVFFLRLTRPLMRVTHGSRKEDAGKGVHMSSCVACVLLQHHVEMAFGSLSLRTWRVDYLSAAEVFIRLACWKGVFIVQPAWSAFLRGRYFVVSSASSVLGNAADRERLDSFIHTQDF
ncbi:hypothetical protein EJ04DRAFT_36696 [Polyplosphaeria fusca]|uniref:Uncharacterized protein n=1 Tax=Polyplosphaeria fusca TaxID=682080 RepID=A0A9P4UXT9_9PLEO|nr:hypothetical protein EJ04DRAFT_36696 [Polyplosphaeria fusca]